jgi:hypothetical protein
MVMLLLGAFLLGLANFESEKANWVKKLRRWGHCKGGNNHVICFLASIGSSTNKGTEMFHSVHIAAMSVS